MTTTLEAPRSALAFAAFRRLMAGTVVARMADWADQVALNWAILQLTDSALALGVLNACRLLPAIAFSVPAGVLADSVDRRYLVVSSQALVGLLSLGVALALGAHAGYWVLGALVVLRALAQSVEPVARQSLLPNLVPESAMGSAIALNSATLNIARLIGPAIAGLALTAFPAPQVLAFNALAMLGAAALALGGRVEGPPPKARKAKGAMGEALTFVRQEPLVLSLMTLAVVPMVFGFPYSALMPVFARDLLGLGPQGFAALLSVSAVGALLGSTWLATGRDMGGTGKAMLVSLLVFGGGLCAFVVSGHWLPAAVALFVVGLASQIYRTTARLALQRQVPDEMRGRILAIALMDRGFIPLGAMLIGGLAGWAGAWWAGMAMGVGCVGVTLAVLAWRRTIWSL